MGAAGAYGFYSFLFFLSLSFFLSCLLFLPIVASSSDLSFFLLCFFLQVDKNSGCGGLFSWVFSIFLFSVFEILLAYLFCCFFFAPVFVFYILII